MEKMTAYCGLGCTECPAYLATQADDAQAREKVAEKWSKMFGMRLSAADIDCDGCKSANGRLFLHCRKCRMRECCIRKELATCAACDEYACKDLSAFFSFVPQAQTGLEALRGRS